MLDWLKDAFKKNSHRPEDVDDFLAAGLADVHLTRPSRQDHHKTRSQPNNFVGGWNIEGNAQQDVRAGYGQQVAPPLVFPQPYGPLPTPPRVPMPMPQPEIPGASRTMQLALASAASSSANGGLRPPEARLPPRPHSDPVVPHAAESISTRPSPSPSTPRRTSAGQAPRVPATDPAKSSAHQASTGPTTPTPRRRRATSTPSSPSPASAEDKVQCSGVTKAGKQCTRMVKVGSTLAHVDSSVDGAIERYCFQHIEEVLTPSGFYSKNKDTKTWIKFEDWIPDYLQAETRAALRSEMEKIISKSDRKGYIYTFEIRDNDHPDKIHLKVGRAVNLVKRIDEWSKQCGSKEQVLRGYWPGGLEDDDGTMMRGRVRTGSPGPWCHRVERLAHLELADLSTNAPYLHPDFPEAPSGGKTTVNVKIPRKQLCPDCNTMHQEIFTFSRPTSGRYVGKEWELLVKPVIEKWGAFADAYL